MRSTTKSPLALAREALAAARRTLPKYSHPKSRREFTQHQHFAILVLRQYFGTDYRGMTQLLEEWSDLRRVLRLCRVPHYSTLCYAEQRLLKGGPLPGSWAPSSGVHARSA